MSDLLPEQWLALARATSSKMVAAARGQLKDGQAYEVDFGVRVRGQVIVGAEYNFDQNNAPKSLDLVQALLAQFGPRKRKQIVAGLIRDGVARVIAPDDEPVEGLAEDAQHLVDGLTTVTRGTRRGNVTGDCSVQLVTWS